MHYLQIPNALPVNNTFLTNKHKAIKIQESHQYFVPMIGILHTSNNNTKLIENITVV